jgi:hypothetical protein
MQLTIRLMNPAYVAGRVQAIGFGRLMIRFAQTVKFPYAAMQRLVKALKISVAPLDYLKRKFGAKTFSGAVPADWRVSQQSGFAIVPPTAMPGTDEVVATCRAEWQKRAKQFDAVQDEIYVDLFRDDLSDMLFKRFDLSSIPAVVKFAVDGPPSRIAAEYLGEVPVLGSVTLMGTPVNKLLESSQLFHADGEDVRQVKMFMLINEVDLDTGPLSFFGAEPSKKVMDAVHYTTGRVPDETVFRYAPEPELIRLTGKPGTALFIDNSRCLHFGSRHPKRPRVILELQYVSRFNVLEPHMTRAQVDLPPSSGADPQRLAQLLPWVVH